MLRTAIPLFCGALGCLVMTSGAMVAPAQSASLDGVWRGSSICAAANTACHDETVVYTLTKIADRPDLIQIQADKIVNGQTITMGSGPWRFDRDRQTLEWQSPRQTWLLKISDGSMEGTLTLADGTVFRRMTLTRDR